MSPPDQPRYRQNTNCTRGNVFEGLNDWEIVTIHPGDPDDSELIESYEVVLEAASTRMIPDIHVGTFIAISPEGGDTYDFLYVSSEAFTYKTNGSYNQRFVDESIVENDMVIECQYLSKIPRSDKWYYRETHTYLRKVSHIVVCDLIFSVASNSNSPPGRYARARCFRLEEEPSQRILDEIQRRNVMEYEDYYDDSDEDNDVDD